ncbi:MAG: PQQ-like beta-propeller repeat protein [Sedimentisphaerales bacterium]|nr:PQQ-like beta-propeller repeat protein [Sedimentisphaerales bacterium]
MSEKKKIITILLLGLIMNTVVRAADWNQFRGPLRDGKSAETSLLKEWPPDGPRLLWTFYGLGEGHSSASIAHGVIYTTGMIDKEGFIFALDLKGKLKWKKSYGAEWWESYPGTRSTPTVEEDRLYLISGKGVFFCFDAKTGQKKWLVDLMEKFSGENIQWGIAESPLIDGEKIYCTPGGKGTSVAALNKMTGETIWVSKDLSDKSAYCCPVVFDHGGKHLYVTMLAKSIVCLDTADGSLLWQIPHKVDWDISAVSPLYHDGCLYFTNGYGKGGMLLELSDDGTRYTRKWTDKVLDCRLGGVVLVDGYIYGSNDKNAWICIEFSTGKVKYNVKDIGKGSVIYADGMLYCYSEGDGTLALVKASPAGYDIISSFKVTVPPEKTAADQADEEEDQVAHWPHPSIANGVLYVRHGNALMAYDIKNNNF